MNVEWSETEPGEWVGISGDYRVRILFYEDPADEPWAYKRDQAIMLLRQAVSGIARSPFIPKQLEGRIDARRY